GGLASAAHHPAAGSTTSSRNAGIGNLNRNGFWQPVDAPGAISSLFREQTR
ncbi:unnamed protein product, partial [Amoebophrya sp. A25]